MDRLKSVLQALGGDKERLVIDLSCRRQGGGWVVAMNKWQNLTDMELNESEHRSLAQALPPSSLTPFLIRFNQAPRTFLLRVPDPRRRQ